MGAKQIFHLEAFVAKYMRLYERYAIGLRIGKSGMRLIFLQLLHGPGFRFCLKGYDNFAGQHAKKQEDRTSGIARLSVRCSGVVERARVPAFGSYVISYSKLPQRPRTFELQLPYISIAPLHIFPGEDLFHFSPQSRIQKQHVRQAHGH